MRIFYIGCLTLIGLFFVFTQLTIFNGGVSIQVIDAPTLPTFIWNLATLLIGVITGTILMGNLVEGYYKYYDLFQNQKEVLFNARDRLKDIENKYSALQVEKDLHILALQKAEQIDDMVRAIEIQYGGRSQTKVDLTEYLEAKKQLWKEVFNYGK
tara:strand:- start:691 stop:1155 length:465 start_codon:yes stop_codon:yes gene_type:complete